MRFEEHYLTDEVIVPTGDKIEVAKLALKEIQPMLDEPVIWRAFGAKTTQPVIEVTNDRETFRGKHTLNQRSSISEIIEKLGIGQPIFATTDKSATALFGGGQTNILLPIKPFEVYSSPLVNDLGVQTKEIDELPEQEQDEAVDKVVKSYVKGITPNKELIYDAERYKLIRASQILFVNKKSRYSKIQSLDELKTYADVATLLKDYISFLEYNKRRREGN